jgi:dihydrofolate reductase
MIRQNVHMIAAIGARGQIGHRGRLPWPIELGDLREFKALTEYCVVVMGGRTAASVGDLPQRVVRIWNGSQAPETFLDAIDNDASLPFWATSRGVHRPRIWIAGGAHIYALFLPFCRTIRLTRINWDGEADTVMPPLWRP